MNDRVTRIWVRVLFRIDRIVVNAVYDSPLTVIRMIVPRESGNTHRGVLTEEPDIGTI